VSRQVLKDRERALEYEFFHRVDEQLLEQLREKLKSEERREALCKATGITDQAVLQELDDVGVSSETYLAFYLFPLVHVAWADKKVEPQERDAILEEAESIGHSHDTESYHMLQRWLDREPGEEMFTAWKDYVHAMSDGVSVETYDALRRNVMEDARRVAKAAGGILGVHKISGAESKVLEELDEVFIGSAS